MHLETFVYYCTTTDNIDIVPDPANSANRLLRLKSTYHTTPLTLSPNSSNIITPSGTIIRPVAGAPTSWAKDPPKFYRSVATVRPRYWYWNSPPDNEDNCFGWAQGFKYGIFQLRCKLPQRPGIQGAFWAYSAGTACGAGEYKYDPDFKGGFEIDGFEAYRNGNGNDKVGVAHPQVFSSTLHANPINGNKEHMTFAKYDPGTDFHTYTFAWTPNGITWFIDGVETRTDDASRGIPYSTLVNYISSHYLWNFDGSTGDGFSTTDWFNNPNLNGPDTDFLIDWIKVWKPTTGPATGPWPAFKDATTWQKTLLGNVGQVASVAPVYRSGYQRLYYSTAGTPGQLGFVGYTGSGWQIYQTKVNFVRPGSGLAVEASSANVFFAATDGNLWQYSADGNVYCMNQNNSFQANLTNNPEPLVLDSAPGTNDPASVGKTRIYYTTSTNQLWYYEWTPGTGWRQYNTYVSNVANSLNVVQGGVFYRGTDNNVYLYQYDTYAKYWHTQNLNPGCYPADVAMLVGGVEFNSRPNTVRAFYLTFGGELKYYEYTIYRQDVTLPAEVASASPSSQADYLAKYEDCVPSSTACLYAGKCPNWKLNTTGNFDFDPSNSTGIAHFNNQLAYISARDGSLQEYRHFKRWNDTKLVFDPTASWYTALGPTVVALENTVPGTRTAHLFGMEDNRLYSIDANGNVFFYASNEVLNPVDNSQAYPATVNSRLASTLASVNEYATSNQVTASPNPANTSITFSQKKGTIGHLEIWDLTGKQVFQSSPNVSSVVLRLTQLPSGLYIYRVTDAEKGVATGKFLKE